MFNGIETNSISLDTDFEHYMLPNVAQTGHLVDVRVGHIDRFKIYEEFQVEYHLRNSGFLKKLYE